MGTSQVATHLVRASTLRGTDVRAGDERIGSIEVIALDMEQGTATAVLAMKDTGAVRTTRLHVPLSALQFGAVSDAGIATTLSRSDFERALSLSQVAATSSEPAPPSDEERLSPTGRTGSAVNAVSRDRNLNLDTLESVQTDRRNSIDQGAASSVGSAGTAGGFNRDRASSSRGVGGPPPESPDRVLETDDRNLPRGGEGSARAVMDVRKALESAKGVSAEGIEVIATARSIQLRGTVRTGEQKARLEAAARKAAGSTPIESDLRIQQQP
jgi:hypothetical protein